MRIWHERLIPLLCRNHLLGVWRESLGCYAIITQGKRGYRNHPAVIEFSHAPWRLLQRMHVIRDEMLRRGYHPKEIPPVMSAYLEDGVKEWQSLDEQCAVLRGKGCECKV